jgi:outer membrane lipoprotein-sorting protein
MKLDLQNDNPNDRLDRSLNALRNSPIPDGPSPEVVADTLAALRNAADQSHSLKIRRFTSMKFITRFAASILLACGLAAVLFVSLRSSVALADIVKKVREAKSVSFVSSASIPGVKDQGATKFIMDNAGHVRIEHPEGMVITSDQAAGKMLLLQPKTRTASVMTFDPTLPTGAGGMMTDPISEFKKLANKSSDGLGTKEIDGKKAKGFLVHEDGHDIAVWADATTGDPVRVEITLPIMGKQAVITMSNFAMDFPIDASLFSLVPPKDYQLVETKIPNIKQDGEKIMIEALKGFAERSNGLFPNRIDAWYEFAKLAKVDPQNPGKLDEATTQWISNVGAMTPFLLSLPKDQYAYLGNGVTLNQKDTIIFWYQNAQTKKYRAIYADLTVKDADPKDLPKAPVLLEDPKVAPPTDVRTVPGK